jgi:hypothetical protein
VVFNYNLIFTFIHLSANGCFNVITFYWTELKKVKQLTGLISQHHAIFVYISEQYKEQRVETSTCVRSFPQTASRTVMPRRLL